MSIPPFWGDVGVKKWSPFYFRHLKYQKSGTFGKGRDLIIIVMILQV